MNQPHKSRHVVAVIILAITAGVYGYLAIYDTRLDDSQIRLATVALKTHDPSLYTHDPVFGDDGLWRGHSPMFLGAMKILLEPIGYDDLTIPFRIMSPMLTLVFLLGMYTLVFRQCYNWSVSVFIAILSTTVTPAPAGVSWGMGPLAMVTPMGVCLAFLPLLVIAFLRSWERYKRSGHETKSGLWRLLVIFGCIGALGNVDLGMSINMSIIMACVYLAGRRFRPLAWLIVVVCLLIATAAATPQILRYTMLAQGSAPKAPIVFDAFAQGGMRAMFLPELAVDLVDWTLNCTVLIVVSIAVLFRMERFKARNLGFWLVMFLASLGVAIIGQGIMQISSLLTGRAPLFIEFARAVPLAMLPLYAFAGQTLANLFRLSRRGHTLRWACFALTAIWMLPSENLRVVRHWGYDVGTHFMEEQDKPIRLRKRRMRVTSRIELQDIAIWARDNTDPNDVFISDNTEFRMLSRRSMIADDNVRWVFYLAPNRLPDWIIRTGELRKMLRSAGGKADAEAIYAFATDPWNARAWGRVKNWYAIIDSDTDLAPGRFEIIYDAGRGEHWLLVRVIRPDTPPIKLIPTSKPAIP
ncbi:MAG: hypothetical protein HN350_11905 [Phycisphaerales bacterium]|jgi:hypothetical protein|nr:hypothetical protein [Phycisphaerales bacterium]